MAILVLLYRAIIVLPAAIDNVNEKAGNAQVTLQYIIKHNI